MVAAAASPSPSEPSRFVSPRHPRGLCVELIRAAKGMKEAAAGGGRGEEGAGRRSGLGWWRYVESVMCQLVFVCDQEETVVGSQQAPGSCPYCGGKVMATDVESQRRLCFLPLCFKAKRRYTCTLCSRRLVLYP